MLTFYSTLWPLRHVAWCQSVAFSALALLLAPGIDGQQVDFDSQIVPILKSRCLGCHGPKKKESGFRLDRRASLLRGGDYGEPAIVPGDPSKGTLVAAIKATDPDFRMPPEGALLSKQQVALLERWIKEGATWPGQMGKDVARERSSHWAFQPVSENILPKAEAQGKTKDSKVVMAAAAIAFACCKSESFIIPGAVTPIET